MKTTSDCIGIREYLLRRGLQPHRETATHGMFLSPLRKERTPKKHKANLLRRLDDYDRWLGHRH